MALLQVRDVRDETVRALRVKAAEQGMSLAAYLRIELDRLATSPSNADVVRRLLELDRRGGPTTAQTVAEIRRTREAL
jgi:plasmid stability protein